MRLLVGYEGFPCHATGLISLSEFLWIFCLVWLYMSFKIFTNPVNDIIRSHPFTSILPPFFFSHLAFYLFLKMLNVKIGIYNTSNVTVIALNQTSSTIN